MEKTPSANDVRINVTPSNALSSPSSTDSLLGRIKSRWFGRNVTQIEAPNYGTMPSNTIPVAYNEAAAAGSGGGGCCCCSLGMLCMIAGGIMWGACKDEGDCNPAVKRAGKITFFTGVGLVSFSCCCIATALGTLGCAYGVAAAADRV